jgi:hypothetical protein
MLDPLTTLRKSLSRGMGLYDDRLADLSEARRRQPFSPARPVSPSVRGVVHLPAGEARRPSMDVQSLLFDRSAGWTAAKAKAWAKGHGYRHGKVHTTDQYIRIRQFDPKGLRVKRTVTFGHGIRAVVAREEGKDMAAKRRRRRSASGKFMKKPSQPRRRRAPRRTREAPVATEMKRRRRHKTREAAPVATEAKRRKRRRHKTREAAPVATEAKRRKRRRHKTREAAPVATEARRRKRRRHRSREAPVATESRRRHKRRRVSGQVMEAKRRKRTKRSHVRKGTKAAHRAAAKKGWAKRRRNRKQFIGPMKRGYTRAAEARRPRRRRHRAREVSEVSETRHRRRRHHRKSRLGEARRSMTRGHYATELALAVGTGSLAYILANGFDRFLATYNPNGDPAKAPKHKFTSDGAGTLANTLNLADHPSLLRIGVGIGLAAAPALGSVFVKHPLIRSSLEGAAVGAGVQLVQMLWSNVLVPLFAPKSTDELKTSFIARLYPAEIAAHMNRKSATTAFTGGTAPGLSGAPSDAPAPGTVGQPSGDVGPFALEGPSRFPSAVEALRAHAAGLNGGHEANRLETGIGYGAGSYPSVAELWRQAAGGETHYGWPTVQDVLTRTTMAVTGLAPAVQAAMPGITPVQADQVAVTALSQPNDIPGALQQIFPDMPEHHRHEFGRRLHQHVHHHHRRMRGMDAGMPGAPPPPSEMFGGLVEEARRRFPHMRHEHHVQIAGHILTEPHDIPRALRRAMPNEPEPVLREHARHFHRHVKHVAEAVAPGAPPPEAAIPGPAPAPEVHAPEHAPETHLAGVGDMGLGYIRQGISSFGRQFSPVQSQQFAAHAYAQPWNLPGVIQHWMPGLNQQQYGEYGRQLHPHVWRQYGQQYGQSATGGGLFAIVQQILPEVPSTQLQSLIAQLQAAPYNIIPALQQVLPNLPERNLHERARRLHPYFAGSSVTVAPPVAGVSQPPPLPNPGPPDLPTPGPNGKPVGEDCGCGVGANDLFLGLAGESEAANGDDRLILG